ncbi:MAG TPA: hypothetical protein VHD56_10075 [Tepidisphaeraceae bacterium]|nr:hypothetical protein [Tepidisphaeraceae bacterium]
MDEGLNNKAPHEPRWLVASAVLIAGVLYATLHARLAIGPQWLLVAILIALIVPSIIAHRTQRYSISNVLGYTTDGLLTVFLLWSVIRLVISLPGREVPPAALLRSAAALWLCNVLLFALWYWRLDAGGPYARHGRTEHVQGAFLFPPMTNDGRKAFHGEWSPHFVDYLFLSFNTSTALSPTDSPVLSRWAKVLVMAQALISLTLVVVLAARAVNLL